MIQINFDSSEKELGVSWCIFTENLSRMAGSRVSQGYRRPQTKKSLKTTIASASGGVSSSEGEGGRPSPIGKYPAFSYSLILSAVTLDLPKTNAGGYDLDRSSSPPDLLSDLISPSSRLPESRMVSAARSSLRDGVF
jgi:hypothetical protein